jgi:serine/threonine protein kinase
MNFIEKGKDIPEIIGEGTYGCVAKPSLQCKGKKRDYNNKVSKVMLNEDAILEYKEMKEITKIPGIDKYIVSLPEMCIPKIDSKFRMTMKDCYNERFRGALEGDYRLLVLEDGGVSLHQFINEIVPTLSQKDIFIFLTKVYNLLEGLSFFYDHNIIHHDIKSRNVVYNIETNKIKYIDFGLMKKRSQFINESTKNRNTMAQKWDNFPPEYDIANKYHYEGSNHTIGLPYKEYIEKLAYTFDSYGIGLMMKRIVEKFMSMSLNIDSSAIQDLYYFFEKMADPSIETRNYNINDLKDEYKAILELYGIWNTSTGTPSKTSIELQKTLSERVDMSSEERMSLQVALSPYRNLKPCRDDQERNPLTRRCVKKCKPDYKRNEKFKCVKTRRTNKNVVSARSSVKYNYFLGY